MHRARGPIGGPVGDFSTKIDLIFSRLAEEKIWRSCCQHQGQQGMGRSIDWTGLLLHFHPTKWLLGLKFWQMGDFYLKNIQVLNGSGAHFFRLPKVKDFSEIASGYVTQKHRKSAHRKSSNSYQSYTGSQNGVLRCRL